MQTIVMPSFDISYPVLGTVKLTPTEPVERESFLVADTYFDPLRSGSQGAVTRRSALALRPAPSHNLAGTNGGIRCGGWNPRLRSC